MNLFRPEVIEAKRRRLWGEVKLAQPPSLTYWTIVLCFAGVIMVVCLVFGTYTHKETVSGYLAPEGGIVQISASRSGRLTDVLVQEGQHVQSGTPLLAFSGDTVGATTGQVLAAQLSQVTKQIDSAVTRRKASDSELEAEKQRLGSQISSNLSLIQILQQRITRQKEMANISRGQLAKYEELGKKGYASQFQIDQLREQVLVQENDIAGSEQELKNTEASIDDLRIQLTSLTARRTDALAGADSDLSVLEQKRIDLSSTERFIERAPISGIISSSQAEVGQSPAIGTPLLSIMPDGSALQAELLVPTKAAGFLKPGQTVRLQIDAYPYQRFGFVEGRIITVSHSVIIAGTFLAPIPVTESVYRARVTLDKDYVVAYGQKKKLQAGMSLKAQIVIDKKPFWRQLFDPLVAATGHMQ